MKILPRNYNLSREEIFNRKLKIWQRTLSGKDREEKLFLELQKLIQEYKELYENFTERN